jgi:hypothetical protein
MTRTQTTSYRHAQIKFNDWLIGKGLRLIKTTDLGMRKDDEGWDHFVYTVEVTSRHMPYREDKPNLTESYEFDYRMGLAHKQRPKLYELMSSLLSDAMCVLNANGFEDFARDLGYDPDSRKAEKLYHQIEDNNAKLAKLFGTTDLVKLYEEAAPLLEAAGL